MNYVSSIYTVAMQVFVRAHVEGKGRLQAQLRAAASQRQMDINHLVGHAWFRAL